MMIQLEEWDWMFYGVFSLLTVLWILAQYKWRRHRFLPPAATSQVEVVFAMHQICHEAGHSALIDCGTYYSGTEAYVFGVCFSHGVFLVYTSMWHPRGSAPEGGDVMTVMIGFSPIARDVSRAGSPQPDIDYSQCL